MRTPNGGVRGVRRRAAKHVAIDLTARHHNGRALAVVFLFAVLLSCRYNNEEAAAVSFWQKTSNGTTTVLVQSAFANKALHDEYATTHPLCISILCVLCTCVCVCVCVCVCASVYISVPVFVAVAVHPGLCLCLCLCLCLFGCPVLLLCRHPMLPMPPMPPLPWPTCARCVPLVYPLPSPKWATTAGRAAQRGSSSAQQGAVSFTAVVPRGPPSLTPRKNNAPGTGRRAPFGPACRAATAAASRSRRC